jgi:hypothetical protein
VKLTKLLKAVVTAAFVSFSVASAFASPVFVNNPSFETLPAGGLPISCGPGCNYDDVGNVPGWTGTGFGQFQPGAPGDTQFFDSLPDGLTVAYSNGATLAQTVGTAQLGTYTLQVDVGLRNDREVANLGSIQLIIGGTVVQGVGAPPAPGGWSTFTATYTTTAADLGNSVVIQLTAVNDQGDFDNVCLDLAAASVPEPASLALLVLGLGFLALMRSRARSLACVRISTAGSRRKPNPRAE